MSSLQELIQAANWNSDQQYPGPSILEHGVNALASGYASGQAQKKAALDRSVKVMDLREKQQKLDEAKLHYDIATNWAKAHGVIPGDTADETAARRVAGTSLGAADKDPLLSAPSTTSGRLHAIYQNSMKEPDEVDLTPSGISLKFKNPLTAGTRGKKTAHEQYEEDRQVSMDEKKEHDDMMKMAGKIAQAKIANTATDQRAIDFNMGTLKEIIPRQDEVLAALPGAYKYRKGSLKGYPDFLNRVKDMNGGSSGNPTDGIAPDAADPLGWGNQ